MGFERRYVINSQVKRALQVQKWVVKVEETSRALTLSGEFNQVNE